ncbi:MAG: glycosyltransferase family 4 protein [Candidatus Methanoperedens sp.]|nr:glycosyltransferase family 4 protein [Candidatus Methanoperedens sp.]
MKILQIYDLDPLHRIGGIEVAIYELSRHLALLGHEVTVISGADGMAGEEIREGVRFINIDRSGIVRATRSLPGLSLARQAVFLPVLISMQKEKYDIYHGHVYTSGIAANILARRHHGIAVNTIHGSYYPAWYQLADPLTAALYRMGEKNLAPYLARICDLQIHACHYFAEQVIKWGSQPDKIRVILNGVDTNRFDPSKMRKEEKFECPVIITARRLVKKNGVDSLLRAMPHILDNIECKLLIIGDGPERSDLIHLVEKLGITNNVDFLGAIPHNDIPRYLALADIAVVPSIVEASSLFMLESMAMGKPVVATGAWGLAEIINGTNGVLTDAKHLADAIIGLLCDEQRQKELGENARQYVIENHTWENIAKRIELEYLRLLKPPQFH